MGKLETLAGVVIYKDGVLMTILYRLKGQQGLLLII